MNKLFFRRKKNIFLSFWAKNLQRELEEKFYFSILLFFVLNFELWRSEYHRGIVKIFPLNRGLNYSGLELRRSNYKVIDILKAKGTEI